MSLATKKVTFLAAWMVSIALLSITSVPNLDPEALGTVPEETPAPTEFAESTPTVPDEPTATAAVEPSPTADPMDEIIQRMQSEAAEPDPAPMDCPAN